MSSHSVDLNAFDSAPIGSGVDPGTSASFLERIGPRPLLSGNLADSQPAQIVHARTLPKNCTGSGLPRHRKDSASRRMLGRNLACHLPRLPNS